MQNAVTESLIAGTEIQAQDRSTTYL